MKNINKEKVQNKIIHNEMQQYFDHEANPSTQKLIFIDILPQSKLFPFA